ncbi:unnamed protein product [Phytophthora lilii]|uniref:Unnamed protein product n=1 Tax=Phytophthora lilii TaxID=2077276 RepID=A0A9W6TII1_9STRA|nr:unnamed protein product [Phytophthora lilii]
MALYEAYISELDDIYARTESVFKETVMPTGVESCGDDHVFYNPSHSAKDEKYHELVGMLTTPFAYERVREFVSEICCLVSRPGSEKIEGPGIPENTIVLKLPIKGPGGNSLVQHSILRRYNEENRLVVVWRKFTEGEGIFAGMHSDETGWCIVRSSPSCEDGSPGTVLESVIRFVPINFSAAAACGPLLKQFTDDHQGG